MLFSLKTLRTASLAMCFLSSTLALGVTRAVADAGEPETATSDAALSVADVSPTETSTETPTVARDLDIFRVIENYRSAIEQKESEVGPYNAELSEMIFGLGQTLQNVRRYDEALHAYKRSLHLKRINNGVYSLSQAPVLRGIIESYRQLGLINEEADSYGQLLWIHMKSYGEDDPRLIPLLDEISQWHLTAYMRTGEREDGYHLSTAFDLYSAAIGLIEKHHGASSLDQINLLKNLAITSYYNASHQHLYPEFSEIGATVPFGYRPFGTNHENMMRRGSFYLNGQSAHLKIQKILTENPDTTARDKAIAQTYLGDWYLLFGRYNNAINAYTEAHNIMAGDHQKEEVLGELFNTPKMLPKLEPSEIGQKPLVSDADPEQSNNIVTLAINKPLSSYVNLTVDITERGKATNMEVKEVYPEDIDTNGYGIRAKKTIRARKFRPRFEAGQPVLTNAFPVRVLIPNENS